MHTEKSLAADAMLVDARKCFGVVAYVQTVAPEPIDLCSSQKRIRRFRLI